MKVPAISKGITAEMTRGETADTASLGSPKNSIRKPLPAPSRPFTGTVIMIQTFE